MNVVEQMTTQPYSSFFYHVHLKLGEKKVSKIFTKKTVLYIMLRKSKTYSHKYQRSKLVF